MAKTNISATVAEDTKKYIFKQMQIERRSLSSMVDVLLAEAIAAREAKKSK